jgi:hypothetical protein
MKKLSKREFLKTAGLATAGMVAGRSSFAKELPVNIGFAQQNNPQRNAEREALQKRKNTLAAPVTAKGRIGGVEFSRLILGGNPIGGWLHSRDLRYVGDLSNGGKLWGRYHSWASGYD